MAIVFGARGNSLSARYSNGGSAGIAFNGWTVTADVTSLSGSVYLASSNNNAKCISWQARLNTPNGRAMSMLVRVKTGYTGTPSASRPLMPFISTGGGRLGRFEINHLTTSGNIGVVVVNELGTACLNTNYGAWSPTNTTWYDVVFTWDGTTTANSAKLYIDAALQGQLTPTAALSASWANTWWQEIHTGGGINAFYANAQSIDEIVIWDSVIDPTSVTLDSGTGSLDGAARTSLVAVTALDGDTYSDPGIANVRSGTSYTYQGATLTGTMTTGSASQPPTSLGKNNWLS